MMPIQNGTVRVIIEGTAGSGKTHIARLLVDALRAAGLNATCSDVEAFQLADVDRGLRDIAKSGTIVAIHTYQLHRTTNADE